MNFRENSERPLSPLSLSFSENEGGRGSKAALIFSKNPSVLVAWPVPKDEFSAPLILLIGCLVNREEKLGNWNNLMNLKWTEYSLNAIQKLGNRNNLMSLKSNWIQSYCNSGLRRETCGQTIGINAFSYCIELSGSSSKFPIVVVCSSISGNKYCWDRIRNVCDVV